MTDKRAKIIQKFMEHIKDFDTENFVRGILFCFGAPTIDGLKSACLINFKRHQEEDMQALWKSKADQWLEPLGVRWLLLNEHKEISSALVLIYRRELLAKTLECCDACEILKSCGYPFGDVDACLNCLCEKFKGGFPHEIGLFLDYPPCDVKGFMENKKCVKRSQRGSYWKVYGNVKEARKTFRKYKRAECNAARLILSGK